MRQALPLSLGPVDWGERERLKVLRLIVILIVIVIERKWGETPRAAGIATKRTKTQNSSFLIGDLGAFCGTPLGFGHVGDR